MALHKYTDQAGYNSATDRQAGNNAVSKVGNNVIYNGINIIVPFDNNVGIGDLLLFDKYDGKHKVVKYGTLLLSELDTERYVNSETAFYYSLGRIKCFLSHKNIGSYMWAAQQEYKLTFNLTAPGGFSWSCKPLGEIISGSVTWQAGDTLQSVVAQITGNSITCRALDITGETSAVFLFSTYNNGELAITDNTGVVMTDCSLSARIGITGTPVGVHHSFQGQSVRAIFGDSIVFPAANTSIYSVAGANTSYYTGCNFAKFKAYYTNNGTQTPSSSLTGIPMNKNTFDSLAVSSEDSLRIFYASYDGSYDAYFADRMFYVNSRRGAASVFDDAQTLNTFLASCVFTAADGSIKNCYPAAAAAAVKTMSTDGYSTGFETGNWFLPSIRGVGYFISDSIMARLNDTFGRLASPDVLSASSYYWSVGESSGRNAWNYSGPFGRLDYYDKYLAFLVRPSLALKA